MSEQRYTLHWRVYQTRDGRIAQGHHWRLMPIGDAVRVMECVRVWCIGNHNGVDLWLEAA